MHRKKKCSYSSVASQRGREGNSCLEKSFSDHGSQEILVFEGEEERERTEHLIAFLFRFRSINLIVFESY